MVFLWLISWFGSICRKKVADVWICLWNSALNVTDIWQCWATVRIYAYIKHSMPVYSECVYESVYSKDIEQWRGWDIYIIFLLSHLLMKFLRRRSGIHLHPYVVVVVVVVAAADVVVFVVLFIRELFCIFSNKIISLH